MARRFLVIYLILVLGLVAFAQDVQVLELEVITIENAHQLEEIRVWESNTTANPLADFSPDGRTLALVLNNGSIQLLSTETLEVIGNIPDVDFIGDSLMFSSDGTRLLMYTRDGVYILWSINNGIYEQIAGVSDSQEYSGFIPSQNLQSYYLWNAENELSVYDIVTHEEIAYISDVETFSWSSDYSKVITSDGNSSISVWDINSNKPIFTIPRISTETSNDIQELGGMGFTPNGNIWVNWQQYSKLEDDWTSYSAIVTYDLETGSETKLLEGEHFYHRLYFDPTETYVIAIGSDAFDFQGNMTVWDLNTKLQVAQPQAGALGRPLTLSPVGDLYAVSIGNVNVDVYHITESKPLTSLFTDETFTNLEFSSDGKLLLNVGYDIRLWGVNASALDNK